MNYNKNIPEFDVKNLKESLHFYIDILGFKIEYERVENKFAFISYGQIQFMLQQINPLKNNWTTGTLEYPFGRGINFQLEVDDVDKIYSSVKDHNYKIKIEMKENWYRNNDVLLGNKEFLVMDPDGYLLRFYQDIGTKAVKEDEKKNSSVKRILGDLGIETAGIDDISDLNKMFASLLEYQRINFDENIKSGLTMSSFFDKRIDSKDEVIYVAKVDKKTVGYIYGYIDSDNKIKKELEAKIESIYVEEDFRNNQIGRQLIEKFIERAKESGVRYITIEQMYMNERAKYLYDKLGFTMFIETRRKEIN